MRADPAIQSRIDEFQPPWLPTSDELRGVVVIIDPLGGRAGPHEHRERDNLSLATGAWLYHLIQRAGGIPVMTRSDDNPMPIRGADRTPALQQYCDRHQGDLIVSIEGDKWGRRTRLSDAEDGICFETAGSSISPARRPCYPGRAEEIYRVLAEFVRENRAQIETDRAEKYPRRDRATIRPVPYFTLAGWVADVRDAARRLWPAGDLPIELAPWFCRLFRQAVPHNLSTVHFEPRIDVCGEEIRIGGATNVAQMRETLVQALHAVGLEKVTNKMRLLPEEGRLKGARHGFCGASTGMTFAEPSEASTPQTQLLYGQPVLLLDRDIDAGYYLVHGPDGYWGWTREEYIRLLPDAGPRADAAEDGRAAQTESRNAALAKKALELLYAPYVFGGVSPLGMDCSGMIQNICAQVGVATARDASQQFLLGRLVATRWRRDDICPGDLLFFIDSCGKIYHVGVAVSPTRYVHCAPPGVQINSLEEGDRLYNEDRARAFFAAKRLF